MMNADNKRTAKEPMKGKAYPFRSDGITATSAPPIAGAGMAVSVVMPPKPPIIAALLS